MLLVTVIDLTEIFFWYNRLKELIGWMSVNFEGTILLECSLELPSPHQGYTN